MDTQNIKVIAHRGSNKAAPQNTMPAFYLAAEEGADGFETDVHLSKDGVPVICHNPTIDATSNGVGEIISYTLAELKQFDFGKGHGEEYSNTPMPTLDEFLTFAGESDTEIINIELKCPKGDRAPLVDTVIREINRHNICDRVIISSFSPYILYRVRQLAPACQTGFLYPSNHFSVCRPVFYMPYILAKRVGATALHPAHPLVNKAVVAAAHSMGLKVNVWTVNEASVVKRLAACGVDGIITDCPGYIKGILKSL